MLHNYFNNYDYSDAGVLFRNVDIPDDAVVVWSDIAFHDPTTSSSPLPSTW